MIFFSTDVVFYVISYAFVSATMLVSNKWALNEYPYPHLVILAQFASSALFVWFLKLFKIIPPPDDANKVDMKKIIKFIPVVAWFYASLMTNLAAMKYLSVDLMILIRTCVPFLVAFGDYVFLGRTLPSPQSWFALISLAFITALVFVREPVANSVGLLWGITYYCTLSGSMIFTRKFITDVKLTLHDRVFWNNVLCATPGIPLAFLFGDVQELMNHNEPYDHPVLAVGLSCILGIAMAYAGWALRARVSALTFTVIGVLCKIGSISLNALLLDHLAVRSMILIVFGIFTSTFYEEPKARVVQADVNTKSDIEKGNDDLKEHKKTEVSLTNKVLMMILTIAILIVAFWDNLLPGDQMITTPLPSPSKMD